MRTLVVGDLHLRDIRNNKKYLDSQQDSITKLCADYPSDIVVFLGDVFHFRKPSPRELLAFKGILNYLMLEGRTVHVLRGNHDSETKADDGLTALSVFDKHYSKIHIHEDVYRDNVNKFYFIPHYEDTDALLTRLKEAPAGDIVFGHFGYEGAYNSVGTYDSEIPVSAFKNKTLLGHVHHFKHVSDALTTLGTPFTTDYNEYGRPHKVAMIEDGEITYHDVKRGIRHLIIPYDNLNNPCWEFGQGNLNDTNFYTYLRVLVHQIEDYSSVSLSKEVFDRFNVEWVDVKYVPPMKDGDPVSTLELPSNALTVDDSLIEKYVDEQTTDIPKDKLMKGFLELKNESEKDKD